MYGEENPTIEPDENTKAIQSGSKITENENRLKISSEFGLCSKCQHFIYARTSLGTEFYRCTSYLLEKIVRISKHDPINECLGFHPSGQLDLNTMFRIAHFIDTNHEKKIGFQW